jgi:hypothetical protein
VPASAKTAAKAAYAKAAARRSIRRHERNQYCRDECDNDFPGHQNLLQMTRNFVEKTPTAGVCSSKPKGAVSRSTQQQYRWYRPSRTEQNCEQPGPSHHRSIFAV